MPDRVAKFKAISAGGRLFQGEIICQLVQTRQRLNTIGSNESPILDEIIHPYAIVITQDCDLENDFRDRSPGGSGKALISSILLCEAFETAKLKAAVPQGKDIWKRIVQNKDERYQCLEGVPPDKDNAGIGMPTLGIDFKRYFTVPTEEVYRRIDLGQIQRRSALVTPYAEHFLSRYFYFQSRFALPEDHEIPLT